MKKIPVRIKNFKNYVSLFDGIFDLTDKEKEVIVGFIKMKIFLDNQEIEENPFNADRKKQVADMLGRDNFNTLNNYIMRLKNKKAISKVDEGYEISPVLMPQGEKKIVFNLIRDE